jgi:protein phosphatase
MLVGAAAEAPRRRGLGSGQAARAADTGELEPVSDADGDGHLDPEEMRYAPRPPRRFTWARRLAVLALIAVLVAIVAIAGYRWSQNQYFVASDGDQVAIFRGVEADVPGLRMHSIEEGSDLTLTDLPTYNARQVRDGISADSLDDARGVLIRLKRLALCPQPTTPSASASPSSKASASPSSKASAKASPRAKTTRKPQQTPTRTPSQSPTPSASPSPNPSICTEAP